MANRDFPTWLRGLPFESDAVQNLLSAIFDRQPIDEQQELTSVASGDELLIFDVSETGNVKTKKATVSNIGSTIAGGGHAGSFTTLTATGLVDISASGAGQIKFPATQNASSDANTLDDYEEGAFLWTIISSGGGTPTYNAQAGFYTKNGDRVDVNGFSALASLGSLAAGNVTFGGLPYPSSNATNNRSAFAIQGNILNAGVTESILADMLANTSVIRGITFAAGNIATLTVANLTATSTFVIGGNYKAD